MIPDNVTLIVKAPNQQIDDQNVECQSSWTVRELKGHLSLVYPSKPDTDEQKIIYSGQLLDDNTVLKDVLRTYESQIAHTMHLVCTPKRRMPDPQPDSTNGLRQRNIPSDRPAEPVSRPEMRQNDQNHTVEMQNYLSSFVNNYGRVPPHPNNYNNFGGRFLPVNNDPASYANHMMMMQQAYLQYMQQYANMWQATQNAIPGAAPAAEAPPAAPQPPPPPEEDDAAPRDWLDHLYAASRLAILFSLVYLYGSPARLLLVLLLAFAGYLHQIGFFRDLQVNVGNARQPPAANPAPVDPAPANPAPANPAPANPAPANPAPANPAPANPAPANPAPANPAPANPAPANDNQTPVDAPANPNPRPAHLLAANQAPTFPAPINLAAQQPEPNEQPTQVRPETTQEPNDNQSLLAVTWMIVTTFFASLIPDTN